MKKSILLVIVMFCVLTAGIAMGVGAVKPNSTKTTLPDIQTFVVMPPDIENVCVWVTADKVGPLINRSCRLKDNCSYSVSLPADVHHDKDKECPEIVARLLAQTVSDLHVNVLPLTIFNGWQWEYSYSMADYDAKVYDLSARGGSWENCNEAVYIKTFGKVVAGWISRSSRSEGFFTNLSNSNITVETFKDLRTRNGYPCQKQL